jgi:ABC-type Na+ efflux pump permease subunit
MSVGLSVTLIVLIARGNLPRPQVASFANGFQAGIGLLLLSISAATVLAEERVRGNLDILLATPLSTRSIVWGKWWGTFRSVPPLAICPGAVAIALACESGRWGGTLVVIGLFLAYGGAVTSLGLALATWFARLDFAVALNVAVLGIGTVGWLLLVVLTVPEPTTYAFAAGSPIVGITLPTLVMNIMSDARWTQVIVVWCVWISFFGAMAVLLACVTVITFDRCLGRVGENR